MTQTLLTADAINTAVDLAHEDVNVPEWGGVLRLQQLNAEDALRFTKELGELPDDGMYLMLAYSAVDSEGKKLYPPDENGSRRHHIPTLRQRNIDVLNKLQLIALRLNKMDAAGKAALKKELSEALNGVSRIDSPTESAS